MGDVASLAVGLHLNAANFKSQLMSAYGSAESQSRQFNRNAQADAKKTEDAYKRVSASVAAEKRWDLIHYPEHGEPVASYQPKV